MAMPQLQPVPADVLATLLDVADAVIRKAERRSRRRARWHRVLHFAGISP